MPWFYCEDFSDPYLTHEKRGWRGAKLCRDQRNNVRNNSFLSTLSNTHTQHAMMSLPEFLFKIATRDTTGCSMFVPRRRSITLLVRVVCLMVVLHNIMTTTTVNVLTREVNNSNDNKSIDYPTVVQPQNHTTHASDQISLREYEATSSGNHRNPGVFVVNPNLSSSSSIIIGHNRNDDDDDSDSNNWRPSPEWIKECVNKTQGSPLITRPFLADKVWEGYVLGDCIKLCRKCNKGGPKNKQTLAKDYYEYGCKNTTNREPNGNLSLVNRIVDLRLNDTNFEVPAPDVLVIHLRLGDVIEHSKQSVETMLISGGDPNHDPNFRTSLKSISEYLDNIAESKATKVLIRGGSHKRQYYKKSRLYAMCLEQAIAEAGYEVHMDLDTGNPDFDFYYMAHAKKFIVSSGGFSRVLGMLVESRGGTVFGRQFYGEVEHKKKAENPWANSWMM